MACEHHGGLKSGWPNQAGTSVSRQRFNLRHHRKEKCMTKLKTARRRCDSFHRLGRPCPRAASDLQSRLLRAVLSERQLPKPRTGKSLHRQISARRRLSRQLQRAGMMTANSSRETGFWPGDAAAGVAGPRLAPRAPSPPRPSAAIPTPITTTATAAGPRAMPSATALSVSPAPGSAARTAAGIICQ